MIRRENLCATDPTRTTQALKDIPYGQWREYEPEETVRFYALRLGRQT